MRGMYSARLRTLEKAYKSAEKNNLLYSDASKKKLLYERQVAFLTGLQEQLKTLDLAIATKESEWRESVLSFLENEIVTDLAYVFPTDGYNVKLSSRVLRGKIHIEAMVSSVFSGKMPGRIRNTQGRTFQQIVSFAALIGVMGILGINTAYIDEAFSGSSEGNVKKLNKLLDELRNRGFNLVMIAQNVSLANSIEANRVFLERSVDNKTTVMQEVGASSGV